MRYLLLGLVVFLSSCANLAVNDVYQKPTFKYQNTSFRSIGLASLSGTSNVVIENPNAYRLPFKTMQAELFLGDSPWMNLETMSLPTLPAKGSASVAFDWDMVYKTILSQLPDVYRAGEADFSLKLTPTIAVPVLGDVPLSWSADFSVPIPKLPTATISSWRVKQASFSNITLAMQLNINNPNVFDISTKGMFLDFVQSGRTLANVNLQDTTLAPKAKSNQDVEVTLSVADIGLTLIRALKDGKWPDSIQRKWQGDWQSSAFGAKLPALTGSL